MKKFLLIFLTTPLILGGCASSQEMQAKFRAQSDGALCLEWMNLPSINIWHDEREAEIKKRGLNCWKYGNVSNARRAADDAYDKSLDRMRQFAQPPQPQLNSTRTSCQRRGDRVDCTTY